MPLTKENEYHFYTNLFEYKQRYLVAANNKNAVIVADLKQDELGHTVVARLDRRCTDANSRWMQLVGQRLYFIEADTANIVMYDMEKVVGNTHPDIPITGEKILGDDSADFCVELASLFSVSAAGLFRHLTDTGVKQSVTPQIPNIGSHQFTALKCLEGELVACVWEEDAKQRHFFLLRAENLSKTTAHRTIHGQGSLWGSTGYLLLFKKSTRLCIVSGSLFDQRVDLLMTDRHGNLNHMNSLSLKGKIMGMFWTPEEKTEEFFVFGDNSMFSRLRIDWGVVKRQDETFAKLFD